VAYALNGAPLPPQHGFPLRLVVSGWYEMTNVKWLERITVVDEPFAGYQQARAYLMRTDAGDPGAPVTRIEPRSLMVPPGIPDFMTRRRFVRPGRVALEGRAWSGWGPIAAVEVSTDGGAVWRAADLGPDAERWAWRSWAIDWDAVTGQYELCCRARDATGRVQPDRPRWNVGGYANNAVHRVPVSVGAATH
jgi:DMSO/TMAO reductase YedYZ molybdopterin-dependent catalytic subunit